MAFNNEIMVASGEAYDPEHPSTENASLENVNAGKAYKTDDPTESTISDNDYFPFYDTSAAEKKKTLWSTITDKLKGTFVKKSGDSMTGHLTMNGTDIKLSTSGSSSDDSSDLIWFYGNGQEKARLWAKDNYTAESGLNYRVYKKDGTSLFSGTIPLRTISKAVSEIFIDADSHKLSYEYINNDGSVSPDTERSLPFVKLAGDTITGSITYKVTNVDASKANNNVSSTQYPTTFNILDNANRILARLEGVIESDGDIGSYWYVRNYNTSGAQVASKGIRMTMAKDGTLTYTVSDSAKFRSAISAAASDHTHNYAGSDSAGGPAQTVKGAYTGNGGKQNPNYFGKNKVGFLMMNTTVEGNSHYKDWIIMDCYSGTDVGGAVAFGVNRQALGAYIMMSGADRTSWSNSAELLGTHNYYMYAAKRTEAIKTITREGLVFTATRCDGTTFTFQQQDNNTWRPVQNNLTSTSTSDCLSANQGRLLANGSARDSTKVAKSGDTMTGNLTLNGGGTSTSVNYNQIYIGNNIIEGSAGNRQGLIQIYSRKNGRTGLSAAQATSDGTVYLPTDKDGQILATTGSSSYRLKENIRNMTEEEALKILDVEVVKFDYKEEFGGQLDQSGVIAEEVLNIIPEVVDISEFYDETKAIDPASNPSPTVDYGKFAPYLIKMIQMQQQKIEELEQRLAALES